ncbi:MAG: 16S rRNA processing protein RimM [Candidatus Krumholzibacteria bacterium]|nr:16S rRNA processing protein RimM [Candidatus Krumholzibacteria bacterium]
MTGETATLGSIVKAVGLKGELKLLPGPDFWTEALALDGLDLVSADDDHRTVRVVKYRPKGNTYIVKFNGIESRDDAEAAIGSRLDVSIDSLTEAEMPGELKPFQVMGAEVRFENGDRAGIVVDILIGPAQRCLIVETEKGRRAVPLVPEVVIGTDIENGVIVIDPPEGLLDIEW